MLSERHVDYTPEVNSTRMSSSDEVIGQVKNIVGTFSAVITPAQRDINAVEANAQLPVEYREQVLQEAKTKIADAIDETVNRTTAWLKTVERDAAVLYANDGLLPGEDETSLLRSEMGARDQADAYDTKTERTNHLLPEVERLLLSGQWRKADILLTAAERKGVFGA